MMKADQIAAFCAAAGNVKAGAAEREKAQKDTKKFLKVFSRFGSRER